MNKKTGSLEKIYTKPTLTNFCLDLMDKYFQPTSILEPTAGDGKMVDVIKERYDLPILAYDIKNESGRDDIVEVDFMKHKMDYDPNRISIMNPPWSLGLKMLYKALEFSGGAVAILSATSLISLNREKYEVLDTYIIKKQEFYNGDEIVKFATMVVVIKNKK